MVDRRYHVRKPRKGNPGSPVVWFEIKNELAPSSIKANVMDLSENGIGLSTDAPLETGQFVKFIKKQKHFDGELPKEGVVMWTHESSEGYKVGVKFL